MWSSLLDGCPGWMQEVAAGTLGRPLAVLIFRASTRPCHTPAQNHPGLFIPLRIEPKLLTVLERLMPPAPATHAKLISLTLPSNH